MVLWDSWLRGELPKAIGRAFGKPSSLFIASWSPRLALALPPRRVFLIIGNERGDGIEFSSNSRHGRSWSIDSYLAS